MFSDILTPLPALGIEFDMVKGKGPCIHSPIRTIQDVNKLRLFWTAFLPSFLEDRKLCPCPWFSLWSFLFNLINQISELNWQVFFSFSVRDCVLGFLFWSAGPLGCTKPQKLYVADWDAMFIVSTAICRTMDDPDRSLPFLRKILSSLRQEVEGKATLIGFVGTPWTLAAYAMEGGADKSLVKTKTIMLQGKNYGRIKASKEKVPFVQFFFIWFYLPCFHTNSFFHN